MSATCIPASANKRGLLPAAFKAARCLNPDGTNCWPLSQVLLKCSLLLPANRVSIYDPAQYLEYWTCKGEMNLLVVGKLKAGVLLLNFFLKIWCLRTERCFHSS